MKVHEAYPTGIQRESINKNQKAHKVYNLAHSSTCKLKIHWKIKSDEGYYIIVY